MSRIIVYIYIIDDLDRCLCLLRIPLENIPCTKIVLDRVSRLRLVRIQRKNTRPLIIDISLFSFRYELYRMVLTNEL